MSERSSAVLCGLVATMGLASPAALPACYDWQLGSAPTDGGNVRDAAGIDAVVKESGPAGDSSAAKPDSTASKDAFAPASDAHDASDCAELEANVRAAYAAAVACPIASEECVGTATSECGCTVYLPGLASSMRTSYVAAVKALTDSGCSVACSGSCVAVPGSVCLTNATGDGGFVTACSQPETP